MQLTIRKEKKIIKQTLCSFEHYLVLGQVYTCKKIKHFATFYITLIIVLHSDF